MDNSSAIKRECPGTKDDEIRCTNHFSFTPNHSPFIAVCFVSFTLPLNPMGSFFALDYIGIEYIRWLKRKMKGEFPKMTWSLNSDLKAKKTTQPCPKPIFSIPKLD